MIAGAPLRRHHLGTAGNDEVLGGSRGIAREGSTTSIAECIFRKDRPKPMATRRNLLSLQALRDADSVSRDG
jgi:hypothetical protein